MKTLREYITEAEQNKRAIAHFNVANSDMLSAVFDAAKKVSEEHGSLIPVVIGVSEGERDAFGETQIDNYIASIREEHNYPIFLNADHTYSIERAKDAIDNGYDMVIIDGADKSYAENSAMTKEIVDYRNEKGVSTLVEAEFGFIGAGSSVKDEIPEGISEETMTDPNEALNFVQETGVDILAPSVGNIHGMVKSGNPRLNPERVSAIRATADVPLVLHGGSGSTDEDFVAVIGAGISMIHISTELRVAYLEGLKDGIENSGSIAPYKYVKPAKAGLQEVAEHKIRLFWGIKS